MAFTRGRCTNVDYCSLAAAKRDIEVKIGEDFICPECAKPLRTPPTRESSGGLNLAVAGGVVGLLLIGGGVYAGYRLSKHSPAQVSSAALTPAPAAATPMAAPPPKIALATPAQTQLPSPVAPAHPEQITLLRLAGSSTLADVAAPRLAAAYLSYLGDTGIAAQPGRLAGQTIVSGERLGRPEAISILSQQGDAGDAGGLSALGGGTADVALTGRRITQSELDRLHAMGDLGSPASEHLVGSEGEAVIVNPRNPVSQLSLQQLRGILAGSITAWTSLGTNGPIHLVGEPGSRGLAGLLAGAPERPPTLHPVRGSARAVLDDPLAIAIVPLSQIGQAKPLAVASLGAAPAQPTPAAVATDAYPLVRKLYLYAPANGTNQFAQRFISFALSQEGQAALTQSGLVPLNVAQAAAPAPLTPKDRYKKLVTGATRLAADLHFEPNSNKLDLRSAREVDRVWNFMQSDHTPPDHLILIGFADNQGTPDKNLALSLQRARVVADVFARRGLPPGQVVAFGSDLSIADNGAEDGRQKNRRVEVFLRP